MPSTSPAQARLMAAVAHGWHKPGGGGPSVAVAKDFNQADKGSSLLHNAMSKSSGAKQAHYAQGGPVLGRTRDFMKEPNRFTGGKLPKPEPTEDDFGKGSKGGANAAPAARGKSLSPVKPRG